MDRTQVLNVASEVKTLSALSDHVIVKYIGFDEHCVETVANTTPLMMNHNQVFHMWERLLPLLNQRHFPSEDTADQAPMRVHSLQNWFSVVQLRKKEADQIT